MTTAYFDASALVKLVIDEPGSEDVAALWDGADSLLTSRVTRPEVRAALAAAHRAARLDDRAFRRATTDWEEFRNALRVIELTPQIEAHAGELTAGHALSGFDAIHLASALALAPAPVILATWDGRLLEAAQAAQLPTLPHAL